MCYSRSRRYWKDQVARQGEFAFLPSHLRLTDALAVLDSSNQRSGGRGWRNHAADWSDVLPHGRHPREDCRSWRCKSFVRSSPCPILIAMNLQADLKEYMLPGLLVIDTPGHESFSNLRNRGSSLCDIAILVVDIMHGLEPQTIESINLLKAKRCPFIVALNKIDRLYNWETHIRKDVREILKNQAANTQLEFQQRTKEVVVQFAEQGLNAALFYENPDPKTYVNLVPTSAISGEGMGNLLYLIVESCQNLLAKRLMYSEELLATVLEVKAIPGLGTTIDAILINGKLREGQTMVIAGTDGPIVTQIRSLLMPQPMKELRVKNAYIEYKEIQAAQGVKIAAKELEKAIAGLNLYVANKPDEVELCRYVSILFFFLQRT